ncbi:DNA-binding transcriptional LysR family regulator [Variovorax beijingensis]|uniref:DNA-binding transcriptional LysR family regulator n=1 Tax=Variovorax beijingensis TaxID=2496117 RepID=A0A561CBN0_9BURK|nr:DNA-binding transcriptional LysR family regulator [Variovorax beijingensis]
MIIDELRIFSKVAELASFSRAADQLGLTRARVSVAVQQLEERLGTRLLQRTTRSVRLTEDGARFLDRCKDYLAEGEQLATMFRSNIGGLTGRLRIDLPATVARDLVIPRLPEFLARHPALEIGISTTDRRVDLVNEGFDCVLRVGVLGDSELVARPLGFMRMANAASPAYLQTHGTPQTLADLAQHRIVHFAQTLSPNDAGWEYFDAAQGRYRMQPMRSIVTVNGTDAYNAAAVAGLGLIQAPIGGLLPCFAAGSLMQVMPAFTARAMPVSLVYVNRRHLAPRVLAVMNWLTEILAPYFVENGEPAISPSAAPADPAASPSRSGRRASRGASPAMDGAVPRKRSRRPPS